jgi:hypothetical protein
MGKYIKTFCLCSMIMPALTLVSVGVGIVAQDFGLNPLYSTFCGVGVAGICYFFIDKKWF